MNGLIIWAHSYCRSTLAFFLGLGEAMNVPFEIYVREPHTKIRTNVGFSNSEFNSNHHIHIISGSVSEAIKILQFYKNWNHIFGAYQNDEYFYILIRNAIRNNIVYAIASEAPCNMDKPPKRWFKSVYLRCFLPFRLKNIISHSSFIINLSGFYEKELHSLGWEKNKIISCGYYPPPLLNSCIVKRTEKYWEKFTILLSGIHQWHRSPLILLKALSLLQEKKLQYHCYITQEGPELQKLKNFVVKHKLKNNVTFLGFVQMERLVNLYENCSIYVGAGTYEPWGMRLNDVLQCGSPIIVNEGMGGSKLVEDYGCGFVFRRGDYHKLAEQLELLISNKLLYLEVAGKAYQAALQIRPLKVAQKISDAIKESFERWN